MPTSRLADLSLRFRRAILAAAAVGTGFGIAIGGFFLRLEFGAAVFGTARAGIAALVLLVTRTALAAMAALVLLSTLSWVVWRSERPPSVRRNLVAAALLLTVFPAVTLLWFRWPRGGETARSVVVALALASGVLISLIVLRRGPSHGGSSRPRWSSALVIVALLAGLAALSSKATRESGGASDVTPTAGVPPVTVSKPPGNILLVSIDTLRADRLGLYGHDRDTSPALDALAAAGGSFTRARAPAPWTLPSHAAMFTGRYPSSVGVGIRQSSRFAWLSAVDRLDEERSTLAEILQAAGYRTGAIANNIFISRRFGLAQGFGDFFPGTHRTAEQTVDEAILWMERAPDRPFFLFVHFIDVHDYEAPAPFLERWVDPSYDGYFSRGPFQKHEVISDQIPALGEADLEYLRARYDGAIRYVDQQLGRLLTWLDETGRLDTTTVVVTSDHGEELGEHGGTGHGFTLYEEQLRVPLVVRGNASLELARGVVAAEPVSLVDITPTLLDLAGLPVPSDLEGRSLRPALEGRPLPPRPVFAEATNWNNTAAVVENGYKYIAHAVPPRCWNRPSMLLASLRAVATFRGPEVFHLTTDPGEQAPLADLGGNVRAGLVSRLADHLEGKDPGFEETRLDSKTLEQLEALGYVN